MTQTIIDVYRIKVLLSITYLIYLLSENSNHMFTCDLWLIGAFRIIHRIPWIFPIFSEKTNIHYQIVSIPLSMLFHGALFVRKIENNYSYCKTGSNLEYAIYFETYLALFLYIIFIITSSVIQIIYYIPKNETKLLKSINFKLVKEWKQTDRICCICYDDFNNKDQLAHINCGHYDHFDCMNEWIKKSYSCPRCKQSIKLFNLY